jgi:hypothetical protein
MKTPMHNYFKGTPNVNPVYYPHSIFSGKGYVVPSKNDLRMQYLFNTYHTIGHAILMVIFLVAMLISVYFSLAEPKFVFLTFMITLPLFMALLNFGIARTLFKDLKPADSLIEFKQRAKEIFTQSHDSKLLSTGGVIALLALFIFMPSRGGIETRIWISAMCFYDFIIGWIM